MPVERRALRSNKSDASSPTEGGKPRSGSSSSSTKKDRPSHQRSSSSRSKSISKKNSTASSKDMSGNKKEEDANESLENGVNGTEDLEMDEDSSKASKRERQSMDGDGDEEMTVVVPPSKTNKASEVLERDNEGDHAMNGEHDDGRESSGEALEDPKEKAIASKSSQGNQSSADFDANITIFQILRATSLSLRKRLTSSIHASHCGPFDLSPQFEITYPQMCSRGLSSIHTCHRLPQQCLFSKLFTMMLHFLRIS